MQPQGKNVISPERRGVFLVALLAAITGSDAAFDTVAAFNSAAGTNPTTLGNYPLATFATVTMSATQGTSIKMLRRGIWYVTAQVRATAAGAATVVAGISFDATAGELTLDPDPTSPRFLATKSWAAAAAAEGGNLSMFATAPVADTDAAAATRGFIRLQLSNGANAAPVVDAGIVVANATLRVEYGGDLAG